MTQRNERRRPALRLRLSGPDTDRETAALRAWLEREQLLEQWTRQGAVRIEMRTAPVEDGDGHPMGDANELLIVAVGLLAQPALADLYDAVKRGVRAWSENRHQVEGGTPPQVIDEWTDDASDSDTEGEE
ncbi:hypothetical protein OYE22_22660 [Streptomyces sp. 71268]|uniref:hypothetical protein n=1 Tax=Streptomyces sp. 71268 TaxID=3002640 RepID=UPI0023F661BB|nr:hypothetical protein [Streptomyces sp. 71268]WEV27664.1 hypothetical protein OYE22_22660 [Streptomyces sp. 71268]